MLSVSSELPLAENGINRGSLHSQDLRKGRRENEEAAPKLEE